MQGGKEWILNSGCSFQMTTHKEFFSTYEKGDGGKVTLGNEDTSKVVGIGTVANKMHDGVIRMLSDVRHDSGLKKSLIALGT